MVATICSMFPLPFSRLISLCWDTTMMLAFLLWIALLENGLRQIQALLLCGRLSDSCVAGTGLGDFL